MSQIAEDGKTILNLSYFFKIDCDLPEITMEQKKMSRLYLMYVDIAK